MVKPLDSDGHKIQSTDGIIENTIGYGCVGIGQVFIQGVMPFNTFLRMTRNF